MTYGHDVGNLHVIDWYLHRALRNGHGKVDCLHSMVQRGYRFSSEDWTRYGGELL
jgi:hypothetical protein